MKEYYRVPRNGYDEIYFGDSGPEKDELVGEIEWPVESQGQAVVDLVFDHAGLEAVEAAAIRAAALGVPLYDDSA